MADEPMPDVDDDDEPGRLDDEHCEVRLRGVVPGVEFAHDERQAVSPIDGWETRSM